MPGFPVHHDRRSLLKLMSIEWVMPSNHLILCPPLLLPPSIFPSIRVFSNESVLHIRWPKCWSFSFSISPCHEYSGLISFRMDWLDLLVVGLLGSGTSGKESSCQCRGHKRHGLNPWVGKIPWRRELLLTPVFWPGEFHGLYSLWDCKESDMTERFSLSAFFMVQLSHLYMITGKYHSFDYTELCQQSDVCFSTHCLDLRLP